MPWGCSHAGVTHAALEPPSSISVSNAWLFVMLCVRCICVEGVPAPGRRQGAGVVMGTRGTLGEKPELSSLLRAGGLGPGGDRGALGHCCSSCAGQSVLVTERMKRD